MTEVKTKRQSASLDRRKLLADPIMVTTIVVLIAFLTLFILYPLAILLVDSFYSKNGLTLDEANRNPARLSRMPGIRAAAKSSTCWKPTLANPAGRNGKTGLKPARTTCLIPKALPMTGPACRRWQMP